MRKNKECIREEYNIVAIICLIILVFIFRGFSEGIDFLKNIGLVFIEIIKIYNSVLISITGDGFLYYVLGYSITFTIVGIFFYFIPIRGRISKIMGKILYWGVGMIIAIILNFANTLLFDYIIN